MRCFVYIIQSLKTKNFYTGITSDINGRLERHNNGDVKSTKGRRPWRLVYQEKYSSRLEAMGRERFLKSGQGRKWLKEKFSK